MLEARKPSVWRSRYEIITDGRVLTEWHPLTWRLGGRFALDAQEYEVRANAWGTKYRMTKQGGTEVASAESVGRKQWTVKADHQTYSFQRPSMWRDEEELIVRGRRAGHVKRVGRWRGDVVAELPDLSLPAQIFVLGLLITKWDAAQAAAATAAT